MCQWYSSRPGRRPGRCHQWLAIVVGSGLKESSGSEKRCGCVSCEIGDHHAASDRDVMALVRSLRCWQPPVQGLAGERLVVWGGPQSAPLSGNVLTGVLL